MATTLELMKQIERRTTLDLMGEIEARPSPPKIKAPSPPIFGEAPGFQPPSEPTTFEEAEARLQAEPRPSRLLGMWEEVLGRPALLDPESEQVLTDIGLLGMKPEDFSGPQGGLRRINDTLARAGISAVDLVSRGIEASWGTLSANVYETIRFFGGSDKDARFWEGMTNLFPLLAMGGGMLAPGGPRVRPAPKIKLDKLAEEAAKTVPEARRAEATEALKVQLSGKVEAILEPVAAEAARPAPRRPVTPTPEAPAKPADARPAVPRLPAPAKPEIRPTEAPAVLPVPSAVKPELPVTPKAREGSSDPKILKELRLRVEETATPKDVKTLDDAFVKSEAGPEIQPVVDRTLIEVTTPIKVYRGAATENALPDGFMSTSMSRETAKGFASPALFKTVVLEIDIQPGVRVTVPAPTILPKEIVLEAGTKYEVISKSTTLVGKGNEVEFWRVVARPPTPTGEQALIPGVKPVTTPEKLAVEGKRPLAGEAAPFGETPLGDVSARGQIDLVEAAKAARPVAPATARRERQVARREAVERVRIIQKGPKSWLAVGPDGAIRLGFAWKTQAGAIKGAKSFYPNARIEVEPLTVEAAKPARPRKAPTRGPQTLLEFLSVKGLREERGELAALEADKWHLEKPFRKRLIRPDGLELDIAREAAAEAGYLRSDSTIPDLLELMDQELRGEPVYSDRDLSIVMERQAQDQWQDTTMEAADRLGIETAGRKFEEIAQEVDRRIRNDPEALGKIDHLYAGLPVPDFSRLGASLFDKAYNMIGWRFSPLGRLPEQRDFLIRRYLTLGKIGEIDKLGFHIYRTLSRASEADSQAILDYFTTSGAKPTEITLAMRASAVEVKEAIRKVGASLVEAGLLPREIYEANKDSYLPRAYYRYIFDLVAGNTGIKTSKQGYLKARKDIPEDVRMLELGQITDPAFLGAKAISQPLRDLVILDFLNSVSENVAWALPESFVRWHGKQVTPYWLKAEAERVREQSRNYGDNRRTMALVRADEMDAVADVAIGDISGKVPDDYRQMPTSKRFGMLAGMWVRKEIYNDVVGAIEFVKGESIAQRILGHGGTFTKITQMWKLSKVALNPPTQVRNFVSNGILISLDGVPLYRVPDMVVSAARDMVNNGPYWQIAKKYGVSATTFAQNEMFQVKTDLLRIKHKDSPIKWLFEAGKVVNMASTVYGLSEGLFKTARIKWAMEHEGMSEADAALAGHRAVFDYSLNPPSVTYLRNAPVGIPFITFYYKVTGRLIETALKRPTKFLPYVLIPMALSAMIAADYDVSTEDLETIKLALPRWLRERGNTFILPWKDQHGRWQVVDYGYFMPWALHWEVIRNSAKGNIRAVIDSTGLGGAPLGQLITAIQSNVDPFTERPISNPADPPNKQLGDWMNWLWRAAGPTWLTDHGAAMKLYQALDEEVTRTGEPGYTTTQAAFRFAGINIYPVDPIQSRLNNIRWAQFEIREIEQRMKSLLRDRSLDTEGRKAILDEYRAWLKEKQEALLRYTKESRIPEALR